MNLAQTLIQFFGGRRFWGSHGRNAHSRKAGPGRKAQASHGGASLRDLTTPRTSPYTFAHAGRVRRARFQAGV